MASSSHYHYHKDDDDDIDLDTPFEDFFNNYAPIPEPKEKNKTYFYREKPGRRPQPALE